MIFNITWIARNTINNKEEWSMENKFQSGKLLKRRQVFSKLINTKYFLLFSRERKKQKFSGAFLFRSIREKNDEV